MMRLCLALAGVAALAACSGDPIDPEEAARGAAAYREHGCAGCHGRAREGGPMGPPLTRLGRHWDVGELARFLADPQPFTDAHERLRRVDERYAADMPGFATAPAEQRHALAAYLLGE